MNSNACGFGFGGARAAATALGVGLLAACATTPPPPPPPPPRAVVVAVPPRPLPPHGAVGSMSVPARDPSGVRQTINANLTPAQKTWNLRSAMNVAALNCLEPRHATILDAYKAFLKAHAKGLSATNRVLDAEFRAKYGAPYSGVRDGYMTQVYNYFALPPTLPRFCGTALAVSGELAAVAPAGLDTFAAGALPRIEAVFDDFFAAYEQYRIQVAQWDAQYGSGYRPTSAGYANPLAPAATVSAAPPLASPAPPPSAPEPAVVPTPVPKAAAAPVYGPPDGGGSR